MVICVFGESCTGKSTLAGALKARLGEKTEVYNGKDYLRLAKNEAESERMFHVLLAGRVSSEDCLIWVVSERQQLLMLPEGCVRVRMTAELETISERFSKRTGGHLPPPVAAMLETKHGMFDAEKCAVHIRSGEQSTEDICTTVLQICGMLCFPCGDES